jgi:hypothetical protein
LSEQLKNLIELIKEKQFFNSKICRKWWSFFIIIIIIGLHCTTVAFAQRNGENKDRSKKEIEKDADKALQEGKFEKALLLYKRLLESDEKNPLINFLVGYCYQNTDYGLELSLSYLKNAVEYNSTDPEQQSPLESYFYLGKAYHSHYQFDDAIKVLNEIRQKIPKNETEFIAKIDNLLNYSYNGRMIARSQAKIKAENLIDINSKYSDKNPIVNNQDNTLVFSSRRENSIATLKYEDGQFDENIFISNKNEDAWSEPAVLGQSLNTIEHESACWISEEVSQMIIQKFDKTGGSLYLTNKDQNNNWAIPIKISPPVNNGTATTFGSFSPDGKYLYFTSDRKGGYGGTDIYISENLGSNTWSEPKNLGPKINTPYNEESPIMHRKGVLFFSSEGHTSIGGFDLFVSLTDDYGNWHTPVNLGIPVNSISNDFFYWPNSDGQSAYISSDRDGTKGKSDIYKIEYSDSLMISSGLVAGNIIIPPGTNAVNDIEIRITDESNGKKIMIINPNKSGNYNFSLPSKQFYSLEFAYKDTPFYYAQLKLGKSYSIACADQTIILKDIVLNPQNLAINSINNKDIFNSLLLADSKIVNAYKLKYEELNSKNSDNISNNSSNNNNKNSLGKYSIKLENSVSKIPLNTFKGLSDIKEYKDKNGSYIYYFGEFEYEWEAQIKLKMIKEEYPNAEVFVFNKNI